MHKFIIALYILISYSFANQESILAKKPTEYYLKQFKNVFQIIENSYIKEPQRQEMTDEAIDGMLKSLDPYSSYYTEEDMEFFIEHTNGKFGGIGVEIVYDNSAIKIITPIDDLPADRAGIEAGDYIIGVNGRLVSNMGFNKSVREMRGEPGSKVSLLIAKKEDHKTNEVELIREIVEIKPVKYSIEKTKDKGIAYIRIVTFNEQTTRDLKESVKKILASLKEENKSLAGIILDIRNNPGGLLEQAVGVSEYFMEHGVVVSTSGRNSKNNNVISAGRFSQKAPKVPIVTLINSGTASAAEIVAGALQDSKRAIILGTTSFGKGLVQTFTKINDRAALKITTAKYYTPSGRSINAKGIEPDIFIKNAKVEYEKEDEKTSFTSSSIKGYLEKYNNADEGESDTPQGHIMSDKYRTDYQYARAYDLICGLIISHKSQN